MTTTTLDISGTRGPSTLDTAVIGGSVALLTMLIWSGIDPAGRFIWFLEALPVMLGVPAALWMHRRDPLTPLTWSVIGLGCAMMLLGAHHTFAQVPMGEWIADALGMARNPYDRMGHVIQGVIPALVARELLLRRTALKKGALVFGLSCCVALAISAGYELVECWVSLAVGKSANAFLGSQGDIWDAQWDMTCALGGAIAIQLLTGRLHDRQLDRGPGAQPGYDV